MTKRYAEGTTVTVESSRAQISGILTKHGVLRQAWASEPEGDMLHFELAGFQYRFRITRPTQDSLYAQWVADGGCQTRPRSKRSGDVAGEPTSCSSRRSWSSPPASRTLSSGSSCRTPC